MKLNAFTLIELLVTTTIIVLMAVIAIPNFNKHQLLIDLQNKGDEVKAGIDEMQVKALNAEKGMTRYYAKIDATNNKVEYGSYDGTNESIYKTVNLTTDQVLAKSTDISNDYLVCDKGKDYCCNVAAVDDPYTTTMTNTNFFTITNGSKTTTFKIFANPFRVVATTN